jgi:hypothetical protein
MSFTTGGRCPKIPRKITHLQGISNLILSTDVSNAMATMAGKVVDRGFQRFQTGRLLSNG